MMDEQRIRDALRAGPPFATTYHPRTLELDNADGVRYGRRPPTLSRMALASSVVVAAVAVALAMASLVARNVADPPAVAPNSPIPPVRPSPDLGWLHAERSEPVPPAGDVVLELDPPGYGYATVDPRGDTATPAIDITKVTLRRTTSVVDGGNAVPTGVAAFLSFELAADGTPPTRTAYGVVLDVDRDGIGDYMLGMDNDTHMTPGHTEWIGELSTGEVSVSRAGEPYGHEAFGSYVEGWFPGESPDWGNLIAVGRPAEATIRLYFWAATVIDGQMVVDYAPDADWITYPRGPDE
jgi:hypothetical protein